MVQKLLVGLLVLTVIGAIGVGVYDASQNGDDANSVLAQDNVAQPVTTDNTLAVAGDAPAGNAQRNGQTTDTTTTTDSTEPVQQQQAVNTVGDPWAGSGTIAGFDEAGMTLEMADMSQVYVELGPQNYWPAQDVQLAVGDSVTVMGFYNGEQYHAATVTKADGSQLALRTEEGLPLWSGGAHGNGTQADGTASTEPQVAAEDWITVEGTVALVNNSALTLQTSNGKSLELQLGQPRFIEEQGISFTEGDAIRVIGYWQGTAFKAGEITKIDTGERLMLLDPNGRPLWGGPGRNGAGQGQTAQSGNPTDVTTTDMQTDAGQGQGQGNSGGGNGGNGGGGNGYQGGRNEDFQAGNAGQGGQ